jgi:hypothetical protein
MKGEIGVTTVLDISGIDKENVCSTPKINNFNISRLETSLEAGFKTRIIFHFLTISVDMKD